MDTNATRQMSEQEQQAAAGATSPTQAPTKPYYSDFALNGEELERARKAAGEYLAGRGATYEAELSAWMQALEVPVRVMRVGARTARWWHACGPTGARVRARILSQAQRVARGLGAEIRIVDGARVLAVVAPEVAR